MDEINRAVELTKARALELGSAYLTCILNTQDAPKTFEQLKAIIEETSRDWMEQCDEIRAEVARHQPDRN